MNDLIEELYDYLETANSYEVGELTRLDVSSELGVSPMLITDEVMEIIEEWLKFN